MASPPIHAESFMSTCFTAFARKNSVNKLHSEATESYFASIALKL